MQFELCRQISNGYEITETNFNYTLILEQIAKYSNEDPYWHQVSLMYRQIEGISAGCQFKSLSIMVIHDKINKLKFLKKSAILLGLA